MTDPQNSIPEFLRELLGLDPDHSIIRLDGMLGDMLQQMQHCSQRKNEIGHALDAAMRGVRRNNDFDHNPQWVVVGYPCGNFTIVHDSAGEPVCADQVIEDGDQLDSIIESLEEYLEMLKGVRA